jgi:phosphoribosylaminoimidazolecarboxamide formyltransferase/IMP cyclohydrolase
MEGRETREVERDRVLRAPGQTISVGAGQMSRVDSVKVGAMKAGACRWRERCWRRTRSSRFPTAWRKRRSTESRPVIQPGGSVKDADVIAAADRLGLAMVFTGVRHFRH